MVELSQFDELNEFAALKKVAAAASGSATLVTSAGTNRATAAQLAVGRSVVIGGAKVALPNGTVGASCILSSGDGDGFGFYSKNGTTDSINNLAATTLFDVVAGQTIYCDCFVTGQWKTNAED